MKIAICARAYAQDESAPHDEVRALARALSALGHAVFVFAASARAAEERDGAVRVLHVARTDEHPEHWHKSSSVPVARAWRELLAREQPDVVHVFHWLGLTRELVYLAACARVPAVVSLQDAWTSCVLVDRLLPDTGAACAVRAGPSPCVACAARVPPRVSWIDRSAQYVLFGERQRDVLRELALARGVFARTAEQAAAHRAFLGDAANALTIGVRAPVDEHASAAANTRLPAESAADRAAEWAQEYARAAAAGAPAVTAAAEDWYSERMRVFAEQAWDRALNAAASDASGSTPG